MLFHNNRNAPSWGGQTKTLAECLQNASKSFKKKINAGKMPAKRKQMCLRFASVLPVWLNKKSNTCKTPANVCLKKLNAGKMLAKHKHTIFFNPFERDWQNAGICELPGVLLP